MHNYNTITQTNETEQQTRLGKTKCWHNTWTESNHTEYSIYPTDAQLDCSKNVKIYIKIYTHTSKDWINMQPLERTDSVNDVF